MIRRKYISSAFIICLAIGTLVVNAQELEFETKTYTYPTEVTCKRKDSTIFCIDKEGKPITGEMIKMSEGFVTRRYQMKNGYIDGLAKSYDIFGYLKSINEYKKGIRHGLSIEYDRDEKVVEKIPYVNGKKEGVAVQDNDVSVVKSIYINDKLNGATQIIDKKEKRPIYVLEFINDTLNSGTYFYNEGKVKLTPLVVSGLNKRCFEYHLSFSDKAMPINPVGSSEDCDQQWHKQYREQVISYLKEFKDNN